MERLSSEVNKMNATSSKIIRTIAILVIIVVIIGLGAWYIAEHGFSGLSFSFVEGHRIEIRRGQFEEKARYETNADGIKEIQVKWITKAVEFKVHNQEKILIAESCQRDLAKGENLTYTVKDGILKISELEDESIFKIAPKKVVIWIPKALSESLSALKADCQITDITAQNITADIVYLETHTGRINVSNLNASRTITLNTDTSSITASELKAKSVTVKSDTGNISLNRITAEEKINAETDTGRIEANDVITETLYCKSDVGRVICKNYKVKSVTQKSDTGMVETEGSFKTGEFRSNTGSITIKCAAPPDSIYADTDTGSIYLYIVKTDKLVVSYSTDVGKFDAEIPVLVSHSADANINLKTSTGNIYIKPYEAE